MGKVPLDPRFVTRLKKVFAAGQPVLAGSLQLIGMAKVRKHFGGRWPAVEARVHTVIAAVIEKRLAETDVYTRFMDSAYVILFSQLDKEKAQLKSALIAEEISHRLFGNDNPGLHLQVATAEIHPDREASLEAVSADQLLRRLVTEGKGFDSAHEVLPPGAGSAKAAPSRARGRAPDGGDPAAGLGFVFRPIWLVRKDMVSAHMAIPARSDATGTLLLGGPAMPAQVSSGENARYDQLAVEIVSASLLHLEELHRRTPVVLPVHFTSLSHQDSRDSLLGVIKRLPLDLRNQLVFEVLGIHEGTPYSRLVEIVSDLKPLCREVLFRVRLESRIIATLRGLGLYAVGVDLGGLRAPEDALLAAMNRFTAEAEKVGFRTFAHGLSSRSLVTAAVSAGFWYLDGDAIMATVEEPGGNLTFGLPDLYQPVFGEAS